MKSKRNSSRMDSSKSLKRASKKNSVRVSSKLESKLYDYEALNILRYEDFETLKVHNGDRDYHVETDRNFLTDVEKIAKIRKNIIFNIFDKKKQKVSDLDCDNIDFKARLHKDANVVNTNTNKSYEDL